MPFIITGPTIRPGQESHVMVNGLDFYPTILSWTGTKKPKGQNLDGSDLSELLQKHPRNPDLVKDKNGKARKFYGWHFPMALLSNQRFIDGWKLIKNWMPGRPKYELYQLHGDSTKKTQGGRKELFRRIEAMEKRVDIEEANNLAKKMPGKVEVMSKELYRRLNAMNASYPFKNPSYKGSLEGKDLVCKGISTGKNGNRVWAEYESGGAEVVKGFFLVYTLNGGHKSEEWYIKKASLQGSRVESELPDNSTHYVFNFIDENNFLVSYPEMPDLLEVGKLKGKNPFSKAAIKSQLDN